MVFEPDEFGALTPDQRSALRDVVLAVMLADGELSDAEDAVMQRIISVFPWHVPEDEFNAMLNGGFERIHALEGDARMLAFVADIALRLPTPELRDRILFNGAAIALGDGSVNEL